ncbi:MAG TPA: aminoacyl-tRNA hydrolase [bacterium]|nr:aminoacyl-tRNA hydrolase [bacterium]
MLVVFLGNPGNQYKLTRHNAGFMLADELEFLKNAVWNEKFSGQYAKAEVAGIQHYFIKPMTFMNISGKSVVAAMAFFKIGIEEVLVVHDDIETEFETVSIKKGGGLAGHNGLRSIAELTGSKDFSRLRIGIGRPSKGDVSSFVLGKFTEDEKISLPLVMEKAEKLLKEILSGLNKT